MGVFDRAAEAKFVPYHATLRFRDKIMGGILDSPTPETPAGAKTPVQTHVFLKDEKGYYIESRLIKAMLKEAAALDYGTRPFPGYPKRATARATLEEILVIEPERIYFNKNEIDGYFTVRKRIPPYRQPHQHYGQSNAQGQTQNQTQSQKPNPQTILVRYEQLVKPEVSFTVRVLNDFIKEDTWANLWVTAQEQGLGALRQRGFGKFDVIRWEKGV